MSAITAAVEYDKGVVIGNAERFVHRIGFRANVLHEAAEAVCNIGGLAGHRLGSGITIRGQGLSNFVKRDGAVGNHLSDETMAVQVLSLCGHLGVLAEEIDRENDDAE